MGRMLVVQSDKDDTTMSPAEGIPQESCEVFIVGDHRTAVGRGPRKNTVIGPSEAAGFLHVDHVVAGLPRGTYNAGRNILVGENPQGSHGTT